MLNSINQTAFTKKPLSFGMLKISAKSNDPEALDKLHKNYFVDTYIEENMHKIYLDGRNDHPLKDPNQPFVNIPCISPISEDGKSYMLELTPAVKEDQETSDKFAEFEAKFAEERYKSDEVNVETHYMSAKQMAQSAKNKIKVNNLLQEIRDKKKSS